MAGARHPLRIGGPAAASLLVNALLIAALLNLGLRDAPAIRESPALTVMSLAVLKGEEEGAEERQTPAPAAAPSTAATTEPAPAVKPVTPTPIVPPIVIPSPLTMAVPVAPARPSVAQKSVASATPSATQATNAPATANAPPPRGAADGLDIKAPPGNSRSYAAKVRSWLYAHKIYPRRARMRRQEGRVEVRFVIDRAGLLLEGVVIHGSGHDVLDEEAAAMMRRASPFPRAPNEVPGERIEFSAPIDFILPA
jgi:protein TonB